ncbi:MAG: hypothetical protein V2I46_00290 [Bacteroides sp.]|nr:hypothetical protein [Bacteroides sp.]
MKRNTGYYIIMLMLMVFGKGVLAQTPATNPEQEAQKVYVIVKHDGARFYGHIISQDAREVLIETDELGQVYIPRHEIREIREVASRELDERGVFVPGEVFSTRYFITTNGLPVQKGENYILWNLFGPDFQFGVNENLGLGVMTSWIGYPIVGTAKYSIPLKDDWHLGLGMLLGTGSWGIPSFAGILPFGAITYGDRVKNFTFSAGYAGLRYKEEIYDYYYANDVYYDSYREEIRTEGSFLFSLSGMFKVGRTLSIVFDSFYLPPGKERTETYQNQYYDWETDSYYWITETYTSQRSAILAIIPGLRLQTRPEAAFQFGFAGIRSEGETVPIPLVQWFRRL